jgi:hypothetical protein
MIRAFGLPHFGQTSRCGLGVFDTALRAFGRRSGCDSLMVVSHHTEFEAQCTFISAHRAYARLATGALAFVIDAAAAIPGAGIAQQTAEAWIWPPMLAE